MAKIEEEIKQKSFSSPQQKAIINLLFTQGIIGTAQHHALKPFGLSVQQFNLLRILKGQYPKPSSVKLLTERMIDKMSNASRLVDKLLGKGLVERKNNAEDRRQVDIVLTNKGISIIKSASKVMEEVMDSFSISDSEAEHLSKLLDKLRG